MLKSNNKSIEAKEITNKIIPFTDKTGCTSTMQPVFVRYDNSVNLCKRTQKHQLFIIRNVTAYEQNARITRMAIINFPTHEQL
jgi:hypothetical protein